MNGNVSQPIAPRAVYNGHLHVAALSGELDNLLSTERIENETYNEEVIQTSRPPGVPVEYSKETLRKTLRKQLDFYFSRQNLAGDGYLMSQMDSEQFVPIWTLANFNMIKKLTNDIELITEVLSECSNVQLNESRTKVRPNYQRCVVILREIPGDTHIDDVKNLFIGDGCPCFVSCEFAGNDAWYITFSTDDEAQRAYTYLRETVKVFRGKPIHARIKAKPLRTVSSNNIQTYKGNWNAQQASTVYEPAPFPVNQQRFLFSNGTPPQMPYQNQVFFPQFPPQPGQLIPAAYVPANHWQAGYYDINTVFQVNGLAPQTPYKNSYKNNGKTKKKTAGQTEQGAAATCSTAARQAQPHMSNANRSNLNSRVSEMPEPPLPLTLPYVHPMPLLDMASYGYMPQPLAIPKEPVPPRHRRRRRDDENVAGPSQTQEVEQRTFDLGHSAFPPLKANTRRISNNSSTANQEDSPNTDQPAAQISDAMPWSDHRIVDILRGNTASKSSTTSTSSKGSSSANDNESPRAGSPQINEVRDVTEGIEAALSSALTLTPPISPEKSSDAKCTMTDKSTKTDDVLLNGEAEACPTTTNAATMTTVAESSTARTEQIPKPSTSSNTPPRMSYAQVAQHPKEGGAQKDKKDKASTEGESSAAAAPVQNGEKKPKDNHAKQDKSQRNRPGPSRTSGTSNGQQRNDKKKQNGKKNPRSK